MILQRDTRLPEVVNTYGCYFMDLLWHANRLVNCALDDEIIMSIYDEAVERAFMNANCFIRDPAGICEIAGLPAVYQGHKDRDYRCGPTEIEILRWTRPRPETGGQWVHFVAGDGRGRVTYDPWGVSETVRVGTLADKRVLRVMA